MVELESFGKFVELTRNDPSSNLVISCDNVHINHNFLMSFSRYQNKTLYKTKLKEYYLYAILLLVLILKKSVDLSL